LRKMAKYNCRYGQNALLATCPQRKEFKAVEELSQFLDNLNIDQNLANNNQEKFVDVQRELEKEISVISKNRLYSNVNLKCKGLIVLALKKEIDINETICKIFENCANFGKIPKFVIRLLPIKICRPFIEDIKETFENLIKKQNFDKSLEKTFCIQIKRRGNVIERDLIIREIECLVKKYSKIDKVSLRNADFI
ncbi:THUMP domain-containing protein 1, partial [Bonamia ostreae]